MAWVCQTPHLRAQVGAWDLRLGACILAAFPRRWALALSSNRQRRPCRPDTLQDGRLHLRSRNAWIVYRRGLSFAEILWEKWAVAATLSRNHSKTHKMSTGHNGLIVGFAWHRFGPKGVALPNVSEREPAVELCGLSLVRVVNMGVAELRLPWELHLHTSHAATHVTFGTDVTPSTQRPSHYNTSYTRQTRNAARRQDNFLAAVVCRTIVN
jgi:hypothetical protein